MLVVGIIVMLVLDFLWICINNQTYQRLVQDVQRSPLSLRISGAVIAYIAMAVGLIFIVFPLASQDKSKNNVMKSIKYGGVFGVVVYTIYNATNYAIFRGYSYWTAIMDTLWGATVYTLATYFALI
jgi:uncharacterized membrane protein